MVKNLPALQETQVQSLGWKDPLEKGMAAHSSTLDWRIPWAESLMGYSLWGHKESNTTERLTHTSIHYVHEKIQTTFKAEDRVAKNSQQKLFHKSEVLPQCEISVST